jgi:hypothetical protein
MLSELTIVLTLLAAAVAMFAANRPRMDAVALLVMMPSFCLSASAQGAGRRAAGAAPWCTAARADSYL